MKLSFAYPCGSTPNGASATESSTRRGRPLRRRATCAALLLAAALFSVALTPTHAFAWYSTWGQCVWTIVGDTLIVTAGPDGNLTGSAADAPWRPYDVPGGVYKVIIGTESSPVVYRGSSMYRLFFGLENIRSVDLSHLDASRVTNMDSMFAASRKLVSINLSGFETPNLTNIKSMFSDCENLVSLDLSSFDTRNVTNNAYLFKHCVSLSAVRLGEHAQLLGHGYLPNNIYQEIAHTGLKGTGSWIAPDSSVISNEYVDPAVHGAGWYLAQPERSSYAFFDWNVLGEVPAFVGSRDGHVTPPTLHDREAVWHDDAALEGAPVDFASKTFSEQEAAAFYAEWEPLPVTTEHFDVVLPAGATYSGEAHEVVIVPKNSLVGEVTAIRYSSDGGTTWLSDAPVNAGTYQVRFDCAAGTGYHAGADLDGGSFTIEKSALPDAILEGDGGVWTRGSDAGFTLRIDVPFDEFERVLMDGETVDPSHYEAKSGSTVVTLSPSYLETLAAGEHTLRVEFVDSVVETTLTTVVPEPSAEPEPLPTADSTGNADELAPTGDASAPLVGGVALVAALAAATVALSRRKADER